MARRHLPAPRNADRLERAPRHLPVDHPSARAGFVLYVGLNGEEGAGRAAELAEVAEALRDLARELLPTAESYTALSLVPGAGAGADDVRDLRDRLAHLRPLESEPDTPIAETA
jgi:hypothetical protein